VAPTVPIRVETFPAIRVAFMRQRGSYANIGALWQRLLAWAQSHSLLDAQPALYGLCPDDPEVTPEPLLRFDACVAVPNTFAAEAEAGMAEVPAGTYAVATHRGPYERLNETYLEVIGRWFPTSGFEPSLDAVVEHYLNDPRTVAPEDLLTEVRVRLAD
jgi:AraC family transcriptional regulator